MSRLKKILLTGLAMFVWLCIWQILSEAGIFSFLLPGPLETLSRLGRELSEPAYLSAAWQTCRQVMLGFGAGILLALGLALINNWAQKPGAVYYFLQKFIDIPVQVLRTLPIAPLVILLLFLLAPEQISLYIALVLSLQGYYPLLKQSLKENQSLIEAGQVYGLSPLRLFFIFRLGSFFSLLASSAEMNLGLAFKAGLAAELIAFAPHSLGLIFYDAKVNLDMTLLFSITVLVILLAALLTKLFSLLCRLGAWLCLRRPSATSRQKSKPTPGSSPKSHEFPSFTELLAKKNRPDSCGPERIQADKKSMSPSSQPILEVNNLSFTYKEKPVISNLSFVLDRGQAILLNAPSGSGKTTLAYLVAGILEPDKGEIHRQGRLAMSFQEPRLFLDMDALDNVLVFAGKPWRLADRARARQLLLKLQLPEDQLCLPLSTYSLGMKQRVALAAALLAEPDLLILDEPFSHLDPHNVELASQVLPTHECAILLISHQALSWPGNPPCLLNLSN